MDDIKNRIEAVLFTTGRPMDVEEIARLCNIGSIGIIKDALKELMQDYDGRNCSLQIFEEQGKYKLNIKKEYVHLTTKLLDNTELDRPTQETLAIIAYKQPMLQCDVIKIRGNKAYDHIKALREGEFIVSEKQGRTRLLKLAPKFYDYFDVAAEGIIDKFKEIEDKVGIVEEIEDNKAEKMPEEQADATGEEQSNTEETETGEERLPPEQETEEKPDENTHEEENPEDEI